MFSWKGPSVPLCPPCVLIVIRELCKIVKDITARYAELPYSTSEVPKSIVCSPMVRRGVKDGTRVENSSKKIEEESSGDILRRL